MTLTLDIKPETEALLKQKAERAGLSLDEYAREIVERDVSQASAIDAEAAAEAARLAAIDRTAGKYAHLQSRGFSSAAIRMERQSDLQREHRALDEQQAKKAQSAP